MFRKKRTYLDIAAAMPVSPKAQQVFVKALQTYGNPSSPHEEGRTAKELLEDARTRIARLLSVKPDAVLFTAGATEANALAIVGYITALIRKGEDPTRLHVLVSPSAHASTLGAVEQLREQGVVVEELSVEGGLVDLARFKEQLRSETVLVALDRVCGETGVRFDTRALRRIIDATGSNAVLHVDASQAPLEESVMPTRLGADTLSLDAQKVGGVRGIGVLVAPRRISIEPLMRGGGQERGIRPGTESPALASAFATALEALHPETFSREANELRTALCARIEGISDLLVNEGKDQAYHILNLSLIGRDTDYLVALLSEAGFAVSTKSACETDENGSRAVRAYTGDEARAAATLRVSFGPMTSRKDLDRFADALIHAVRFMDTTKVY